MKKAQNLKKKLKNPIKPYGYLDRYGLETLRQRLSGPGVPCGTLTKRETKNFEQPCPEKKTYSRKTIVKSKASFQLQTTESLRINPPNTFYHENWQDSTKYHHGPGISAVLLKHNFKAQL